MNVRKMKMVTCGVQRLQTLIWMARVQIVNNHVVKARPLASVVHSHSFIAVDSTIPVLLLTQQILGVLLLRITTEIAFVAGVCEKRWLKTEDWIFLLSILFVISTF